MLTIQPKDDAFCTVKRKTKSNKKRNAVECWYASGFTKEKRRNRIGNI